MGTSGCQGMGVLHVVMWLEVVRWVDDVHGDLRLRSW